MYGSFQPDLWLQKVLHGMSPSPSMLSAQDLSDQIAPHLKEQ